MANNIHKKDYQEDKFGRRYYYQHARLNQVREDKKEPSARREENIKNF